MDDMGVAGRGVVVPVESFAAGNRGGNRRSPVMHALGIVIAKSNHVTKPPVVRTQNIVHLLFPSREQVGVSDGAGAGLRLLMRVFVDVGCECEQERRGRHVLHVVPGLQPVHPAGTLLDVPAAVLLERRAQEVLRLRPVRLEGRPVCVSSPLEQYLHVTPSDLALLAHHCHGVMKS